MEGSSAKSSAGMSHVKPSKPSRGGNTACQVCPAASSTRLGGSLEVLPSGGARKCQAASASERTPEAIRRSTSALCCQTPLSCAMLAGSECEWRHRSAYLHCRPAQNFRHTRRPSQLGCARYSFRGKPFGKNCCRSSGCVGGGRCRSSGCVGGGPLVLSLVCFFAFSSSRAGICCGERKPVASNRR